MGSDEEIIFKTFSKIVPIHLTLRYRTGNSLTEMWEWSRSLQEDKFWEVISILGSEHISEAAEYW